MLEQHFHDLARTSSLHRHTYNLEALTHKSSRGRQQPAFLPERVQNIIKPLFDFSSSLKATTSTVHFTEDTKEFLIDTLENELSGATNIYMDDESAPPASFIQPATQLRQHAKNKILDIQWAERLVQAARRDLFRPTCNTWSDLMLYCRYAAEPFGRAILQACEINTTPEIEKATDSLCAALLVHNLLRRARNDWLLHGRCYLPLDWIREEEGTAEQLMETSITPPLRQVYNRVLERTKTLTRQAAPLPHLLKATPPLKAEASRTLAHARYQNWQLKRQDPLAEHLRTPQWVRVIAYLEGWLSSRS